MFWHLILGLLRDGRGRHGYELMTQYAARSGTRLSAGSFYRELSRLVGEGLLETGVNPPGSDPRRIPYTIAERGAQAFDRWLDAPSMNYGDLGLWLFFADRASVECRNRVLGRREEDLWMRSKALSRLRDDALARGTAERGYDPLPVLLSRELKQITAEIEFIREFRADFDARLTSRGRVESRREDVADEQPTGRRRKAGRRR